jgi:hypothetical protein
MNEEEEVEEKAAISREVWVSVDSVMLPGELSVPGRARGVTPCRREQSVKSTRPPVSIRCHAPSRLMGVGSLERLLEPQESTDPLRRYIMAAGA